MLSWEHSHADASANWTDADSHVNYRYLKTPEKTELIQALHRQNDHLNVKKLSQLQSRLKVAIEQQAAEIDDLVTEDLSQMMHEEEAQMQSLFPKGSFQQVFWQQQKRALQQKHRCGIRWHSLMICFCLYLQHHSGKVWGT